MSSTFEYHSQQSDREFVLDLINRIVEMAKGYLEMQRNNDFFSEAERKDALESRLFNGSIMTYSILKTLEQSTGFKLDNKYGTVMEIMRKHVLGQRQPEELIKVIERMVFQGIREHEDSGAGNYFPGDKNRISHEKLKELLGVIPVSEAQNKLRAILKRIFHNYQACVIEEYPFYGFFLDFYIADLNLAVEYDGRQHFEFCPEFHKSEEDFRNQQRRDWIKNRLCKSKGIGLVRIRYDDPMEESWLRDKIDKVLLESLRGKNSKWQLGNASN